MPDLSRVTVIIPAHNRPERLRRLLDYYGGTALQLLVPDSSDRPFPDADAYPSVTYLHRPRLHFLLKIREVLPLIKTPYVLYCADDDFTVPAAIGQVIDFLDAHPDYSVAQGHYLTFTPGKWGKVAFMPRYIRHLDKRVTADTPRERLLQERDMYASLLYAVTRTEVFRAMYAASFDASGTPLFRNLFLAEELFNHAVLIFGKYATLPCFYSAREYIPGSATDCTVPPSVVKSAPAYRGEYQGFLQAMGALLASRDGSTPADATAFMRTISEMPKETAAISRKQALVAYAKKHAWLHWLGRLADRQYRRKGLKAVKGMPSYPCTFSTPEREAIEQAIRATR